MKLLAEGLKPGVTPQAAAAALQEGLERWGRDLTNAKVADYRNLYHEGWTAVLDRLAAPEDHDWLTDKFKALMF